jgi:S-formylglutathione hydrolase
MMGIAMLIETLSEQKCLGGVQGFYRHESKACRTPMRFAVYVPPQAKDGRVPTLTYLAGLTCSDETFPIKASAQRLASELGLLLVAPDTSPRGAGIPGEDDDWDFGTGASFYLDATQAPWSEHYNMYTYVTCELQDLIGRNFPTDRDRQGIFGHSMGGHGALTLHLKNPDLYATCSAFAPIVAASQVPWGQKAFTGYLGTDITKWNDYDACALLRARASGAHILVDQGLDDPFLDRQLKPELLEAAARERGQNLTLRRHQGYDHSYYFVQTFVADHLRHHAAGLGCL